MSSYSQAGEDVWIIENLKPEVGTFCEVGAFDGVKSSNTLLFEELGWTGLLIEADPFLAAQAQLSRKAPCLCCAVGPGIRIPTFRINLADRGLSGFDVKGVTIPIPVAQFPLCLILNSVGLQNLDLLSIDTEGTELEVWSSIGDIRPRIVIMEYQTCDEPPQDDLIVHQMTRDCYKEVHRTKHNLIFLRQ